VSRVFCMYISKLEIEFDCGVSQAAACDTSSTTFELPERKLNIHQFKLLDVRMLAAERESMNLSGFLYIKCRALQLSRIQIHASFDLSPVSFSGCELIGSRGDGTNRMR
jgi:hypothetical protein